MKAVLLEDYNPNLIELIKQLKVSEIEIPTPSENQVLIKMKYATCNPSDIAFMRGMYNVKKDLPKALGFEGCGIVVKAGENSEAQKLMGKRVSCFVQGNNHGTWSEFMVTEPQNCIKLIDEISDEQAACLFVNPFTAFGMYELAKAQKPTAILLNAAMGRVPEFIRVFAKKDGIEIVNIVRRDNHVEQLINSGEKYAISSRSKTFDKDLADAIKKTNPTIFFDAVGGSTTGQIIGHLPENSQTLIYGGLSGEAVGGIDVLDVIFKNKSIAGFDLNKFMLNSNREYFDELAIKLQELIVIGDIKTNIQLIAPPEEAGLSIRQYITHMSDGKILLKFE